MSTVQLLIMRHGPSEDSAPSGRDFDRALSVIGRARTLAVARDLARRGESPVRILSSPLVRARETAELVASVSGNPPIDVREELAPSGDAHDVVLALEPGSDHRVLLVSHAPDVSLLAERLLGRAVGAFAPAMVLAIELTGGRAVRRFVIDPARVAQ